MFAEIQLCWWKILEWRREYGLNNLIPISPRSSLLSAGFCSLLVWSKGTKQCRPLSVTTKWLLLEDVVPGAGDESHRCLRAAAALARGGWMVLEQAALWAWKGKPWASFPMEVFHQENKTIQLLSCFCSLQSFGCVSVLLLNPFTPGQTATVHISNHVWSVTAKKYSTVPSINLNVFRIHPDSHFCLLVSAFHKEKARKTHPICWRLI